MTEYFCDESVLKHEEQSSIDIICQFMCWPANSILLQNLFEWYYYYYVDFTIFGTQSLCGAH